MNKKHANVSKLITVGSKYRIIITIVSVTLLLIFSFTSIIAASADSLPSSPLYPVKRSWELITQMFSLTPDNKASTELSIANTRVKETASIDSKDTSQEIKSAEAVNNVSDAVTNIKAVVDLANQVNDPNIKKQIIDQTSNSIDATQKQIENQVHALDKIPSSGDQEIDNLNKEELKSQLDQATVDLSAAADDAALSDVNENLPQVKSATSFCLLLFCIN